MITITMVSCLVGCNEDDSWIGNANVSPLVEQWRSDVERIAAEHGISEHVELILAMIAQESGGDADRYPDILQCSESAGLPPNSIKDPIKSLEHGIKYLAGMFRRGKELKVDTETVVQSYNFGGGYMSYIVNNYERNHSEVAARAFSAKMCKKLGWSKYGDVLYVQHVYSKLERTFNNGEAINNYDKLYKMMKLYEGTPYKFGGESFSGIDCSALMQKCYGSIGISLPRVAQAQWDATKRITEHELVKGDLVFFTGTYNSVGYISHVGIYVGDGRMFHASSKKGCVFAKYSKGAILAGYGRIK